MILRSIASVYQVAHERTALSDVLALQRYLDVGAHLPITPPCCVIHILIWIRFLKRFDHPNQVDLSMLGTSSVLSCFNNRRRGLRGWHERSRLG